MTGFPKEGDSERRTFLGIIVLNTRPSKFSRTSLATWSDRLFRESNIVRSTPSNSSVGLSPFLIMEIVSINLLNPSSA
jgi:hypothetical protein